MIQTFKMPAEDWVRETEGWCCVAETLWPEYLEFSKILSACLTDVTNRVIA